MFFFVLFLVTGDALAKALHNFSRLYDFSRCNVVDTN